MSGQARPWNCDSGAEGGEDIQAGQQAPASHCTAVCARHHWDKTQDTQVVAEYVSLDWNVAYSPAAWGLPLIQLYRPVSICIWEPDIMSKESEEEQVQGVKLYFAPEHHLDSKGA